MVQSFSNKIFSSVGNSYSNSCLGVGDSGGGGARQGRGGGAGGGRLGVGDWGWGAAVPPICYGPRGCRH